MSLPLVFVSYFETHWIDYLFNQWTMLAITALSAYVMNAEIPLFSLKIKDFSFKKYSLQIGFLAASVIMLCTLQFFAVPLIIIMYVLISIVNNILTKK